MRRFSCMAGFVLLLASTVGRAPGQPLESELERRFLQQQRLLDERLERQRLETAPLDALVDLQWGGWLEYYVFHYDDGVQESRLVQRPGLSAWTRLRLDGDAHEFFARVKLRFTYFEPGDEIDRQQDWWGPNFDLAWYQLDLGRALHMNDPDVPLGLRARIGRQQVVFGTGYVLDIPMDAVLLDARLDDLRVEALFGKSIPSYPNIDRSEPVDSHSDRLFYGLQISYEGWARHVPFAYVLWNNDRTDERPPTWYQNYSYDSFYAGFGLRGELASDLHYWAEGVFESGHSFGDNQFLVQDYVEAFAWDAGIEKRFDIPTQPRLVGEYMFASGDGDRLFSPTNAAGGNRRGREDTSFVGFGFRDTGIALAPTMSNLHVWRLGGSLQPLESWRPTRDLEVGTNWFLYHKNRDRGAISDPLADMFEGWVGWEMDYYINWRFASDLSWTARWGTFYPGSAYSDRSQRHFFFTGLTWSF